jgi:formiminotetrahydrofolate cyclodeaminase
LAAAGLEATRVPLETAEACLRVLELAEMAVRQGNSNAASDAGVAGLLAAAGAEGALLNVQINLKSLPEGADKEDVHKRLQRLAASVPKASAGCREAVQSILTA